jgi:hypothetical protein
MGATEISIQGTLDLITDAIIPANPGPLPTDGNCSNRRSSVDRHNRTSTPKQRGTNNTTVPRKQEADAQHSKQLPEKRASANGRSLWQVAYAYVLSGPMTVVSPRGTAGITAGNFEYLWRYDSLGEGLYEFSNWNWFVEGYEPWPVTGQEAKGQAVLPEPYVTHLTFFRQVAEY